MQQTYSIVKYAPLNNDGLQAFNRVRIASTRDGRERTGSYMTHNDKIYDVAVTEVGDTHSVLAANYLTSFHTHPRTKEAVSATDLVVLLTKPREFRDGDSVEMVYGRSIVVSNIEVYSYAPNEGAVRLMMDPSIHHANVLNVIYWTARVILRQYATATMNQTNTFAALRHLDPQFALYQLDHDNTIERTITSAHPNGVPEQFGDLALYRRLVANRGMSNIFDSDEIGFDVRLVHRFNDDIAHMPALSDAGVAPRDVEAAVNHMFNIPPPMSQRVTRGGRASRGRGRIVSIQVIEDGN